MKDNKQAPKTIYVQIYNNNRGLKDSTLDAYHLDPRTVHDNGKPVYEYELKNMENDRVAALKVLLKDWDSMKVTKTSLTRVMKACKVLRLTDEEVWQVLVWFEYEQFAEKIGICPPTTQTVDAVPVERPNQTSDELTRSDSKT